MEIHHDPDSISRALYWVVNLLERFSISYQVVGGLAAQAYGATRPLVDIDLYIPMDTAKAAMEMMKPFLVREALPHHSASWDLIYLALVYDGITIEIGDTCSSPRFFNRVDQRWEPQVIDYAASQRAILYSVEVSVMPRDELVRYKAMLNRDVDVIDIQQMTAAHGVKGHSTL